MTLRGTVHALAVVALLVVGGLVTVSRLLVPQGGTGVRLVAFTPHAVVLYLLAVLLLLPVACRGRGRDRGAALRRAGARALVVAGLLGVALHAAWAAGPWLGGRPGSGTGTPTTGAAPLRVMTANLRLGQGDTARVMALARAHRVDVLTVQEVTPQAWTGLREAGVLRRFAHRAGRPAAGPAGTMVFSRTRISGVRRLPTPFGSYALDVRVPAGAGAAAGRVHLLAVHPRPPVGDALGWRADQLAVRRAARGPGQPTVVAGDLNATMDHAPLRELVGRGYQDAATAARSGWQPTWPSSGVLSWAGVAVPPLLALDHVLVKGELRAVRTESFPVRSSDHRALVATLVP